MLNPSGSVDKRRHEVTQEYYGTDLMQRRTRE